MDYSVCIFAHNEERNIKCCLENVCEATEGAAVEVHVMVNGSTDRTLSRAGDFAARNPWVYVHDLQVADKATAWNTYVHDLSSEAATHIFLDGDMVPGPESFSALRLALEQTPKAYAAAAVPGNGRSRKEWRDNIVTYHFISGNLYAISRIGMERLRSEAIFLPRGAKGEDGLLAYLFLTDLKGGQDTSHTDRVVAAKQAFFYYDFLRVRPHDLKIYWRRLHRYSERHFQNRLLYKQLKQRGVEALPGHIREIYTPEEVLSLRPRNNLQYFLVDRIILRKIRRGKLYPE